jgi:hypothetical protein
MRLFERKRSMRLPGFHKTLLTVLFSLSTASSALWGADIKPEEVLAKHLDAIGSAQARKALKSRVVVGGATYRVLVGGSGAIDGKFQFASEGSKSDILFKVNANGFLGEQFICDGDKTSVAGTYSDKHRSEFGIFSSGRRHFVARQPDGRSLVLRLAPP